MYETLALLAVFVLLYSSVAGAVERAWISGPIIFTLFGLIIGPLGLDLLSLETDREMIKGLAEVTLAMVLFKIYWGQRAILPNIRVSGIQQAVLYFRKYCSPTPIILI